MSIFHFPLKETALGLHDDQSTSDSFFDMIDSNEDGNLQVWEFLSLQNVQLPNDKLDRGFWGNVKTAFGIGQQAGGWLRDNVYNFQTRFSRFRRYTCNRWI